MPLHLKLLVLCKPGELAKLHVESLRVVELDTANKPGKIYDGYKSDDGFLYIAYSAENTLG